MNKIGVVIIFLLLATAFAAQRVVVMEEFTRVGG
jgi:hypothetical protein